MDVPSQTFQNAVEMLSRLPTIGRRSAYRLALYIMKQTDTYPEQLGEAIAALSSEISYCEQCYNISDAEICAICSNKRREIGQLCIVEDIPDLYAIESTSSYQGKYHIVGGLISPMNGVSPDSLNISEIPQRVFEENITEVILALNTTMEGDTTSYYISKLLKDSDAEVSTLSRGVGIGDRLEYVDELTLTNSILKRIRYEDNVR